MVWCVPWSCRIGSVLSNIYIQTVLLCWYTNTRKSLEKVVNSPFRIRILLSATKNVSTQVSMWVKTNWRAWQQNVKNGNKINEWGIKNKMRLIPDTSRSQKSNSVSVSLDGTGFHESRTSG